ncbi:DUF192 domain-containing protein [Patescibacteria group bacterium]|nr:DUF192 domain-containing protein [Patescibacteria group bacterium]
MPTFTQSRVKILAAVVIFILGIIVVGLLLRHGNNIQTDHGHRTDLEVRTPGGSILHTQVADDPAERSIGLSNHDNLAPDEAMLFFFDQPGAHSFWMKDMAFPIDIVWLGDQGEVLFVVPDADPSGYPKIYTPPVPATYVIELVAGFASDHGIETGNRFTWQEKNQSY